MEKFKTMGYMVKYKTMGNYGKIYLINNNTGDDMEICYYNRGRKKGMNDHELGVRTKEDFMKLYDMLKDMDIDKMEFHIEVLKNMYTSDIIDKIQTMGYRVKFEQLEDGTVLLHMMNGGYMDVYIKKYEDDKDKNMEDSEYDEYEITANNKEDFMKLHELFSRMMM